MVIRDILLARLTGGHVHLCHMSTRGSVELIRWGKERGIRVTAEVCPHHLSLTEDAVEGYDTNAKMNPPLRTAADVEALQQALKDGTIDVIATDHAPHHYDEKEREFADAPNGIIGLETALAVNITWLVKPGHHRPARCSSTDVVRARAALRLPGGTLRGARWPTSPSSTRAVSGRSRSVALPLQGAQHAVRGPRAARPAALHHRGRSGRPCREVLGRRAVSRTRTPRRSSPSAGACTTRVDRRAGRQRLGAARRRTHPRHAGWALEGGRHGGLDSSSSTLDGDAGDRRGVRASSEVGMHLRIYRARPDVRAVVHAHPPVATGFGVAGRDFMDARACRKLLPPWQRTARAVSRCPVRRPSLTGRRRT